MHLTSVEFMMDVSFWKISASYFLLDAASEQSKAVMMCTVFTTARESIGICVEFVHNKHTYPTI